ncbi:4-hydroxy-tetrahydrodipicolinate synthase [Megasphaera sueciensis]|jgi:4-hydroxy-tetrahydrodipicolinate synthase|uniref:4-hydroxy-tetrahydrodipicolinate synthase n=1 Tax=Megasphaera sueciensis TaxID=349094 RepID=UPI003CFC3192|nr:4-hydroxy-tetrahydrodipicolinate synthase [Megasphaera sp.]
MIKKVFKPHGVIPAMITPLTKDGTFNESATRKLIDYLIGNGVHGLFVVGTTGEFYGFSLEEKRYIFQVAMDQANGRVPIYAGTNAITTKETVALTQMAEECKVDCVSILTPMFIKPSQEELYMHYKTVADNTSLPIIIYNNPPKTGVNVNAETIAKLADISNIVAAKESSGDMTLVGEYIRLTQGKDFSVLVGRDTMIYSSLVYGASGAIASCANVAPRLCADIYDKYQQGDLEGALKAQYQLAPLRIAFKYGTFPAVIKESLTLLGIDAGPCMGPCGPLKPEERAALRNVLVEMELLG